MSKDPFRFYSNKMKSRDLVNRFACESSNMPPRKEDDTTVEVSYCYLIEQIIEYYKLYCKIINKMNKIKNDYQNKNIPDNVKDEFIDLNNEKNDYKKIINDSMSNVENYAKILEENNTKEHNEFYLKAVYENSTRMWKFVKH
tara:strand:- start:148 stop:573 length:426 start_codon:yes stop_codon:yes gene_type:complete